MSGGLEKIQTLEDSSRLTREEKEDVTTRVAPRFTVPFNNIDDLREGENAHFEARLTPVDDPKLKVRTPARRLCQIRRLLVFKS